MHDCLLSSKSNEYATPQDFFDALNAEFGFTLDVAATPENAKCKKFFTIKNDGLSQNWGGECVWMNPPYGREIGKWIRKAFESNTTAVCLIPARTDTAYWHDYAMKGEIRFVRGRLKFGTEKHNAPFPCAVVIFRPR